MTPNAISIPGNMKFEFPYKTVMIVDDNKIDRLLVELNVKRFAFAEQIISKSSARSAIEYLESSSEFPDMVPGIIFLDIQMPEIDGFGFLDNYEKLPASITNNCMIILLTSSLDPKDIEKAKNNKFVKRFIGKPVNAQILKEIASDAAAPQTGINSNSIFKI